MTSARIRHVVVVGDENKPVGVLSLGDLVEDGIRQTGGLTAGQSIRRPLTTVATIASARSAAAAMARYGLGCLPVVGSDGALVSVITRIDIARALVIDLKEAARKANEEAPYSYRKPIVGLTMEDALAALRNGLQSEGFSVVAEIPLSDTLNEKVGAHMTPYRVLLACNPALAVDALAAERELGLLLPCHVILYEREDGTPVAAAIEPRALVGVVHGRKPELDAIADETEARLHRAVDVARGFSERLAASAS